MKKQMSLLFILFGLTTLSTLNIKAETENILTAKIKTPAEILNRCEQDIYTMNPDNIDSVKNILNIVVQTITIGIEQFQKSVNTVNHTKKEAAQKEGLLEKINRLLSYSKGFSWNEMSLCRDEANYKMKVILLSQKSQELFNSLSKHDQAIVQNVHHYIVAKIRQRSDLFYDLPLCYFFEANNY